MRKALQRKPKTPLQEVFLRRLKAEMEQQGVSGNALAQRVGAPPQRTIADVLNGADPRLETVHALATALGIPALQLLTEASNVRALSPYPKMIPTAGQLSSRDRKKRTG